ncbi:MAG: hypothetical protein AB8B72_13905 [Crocinitomicaceae bacterium]
MMRLQVVDTRHTIKTIALLLLLTIGSIARCQEVLPTDSIKNYIIADSALTKFEKPNHFLEAKNTDLGIVLYEPRNTLIEINSGFDTLIELDGFERYHWAISSIDTLSNGLVKITCADSLAWGSFKAVFTLQELSTKPPSIIMSRVIYDEKSTEMMSYQKLIIEQVHLKKMVCLREPTPYIPESSFPFLKVNFKTISFASKKDFLR